MHRNMVGLLAAVGAAMSALLAIIHGDLVPLMIAVVAFATGTAARLAIPPKKNISVTTLSSHYSIDPQSHDRHHSALSFR